MARFLLEIKCAMAYMSKQGAERRCNRWVRTNMSFQQEEDGVSEVRAIRDLHQHLIGSLMQLPLLGK